MFNLLKRKSKAEPAPISWDKTYLTIDKKAATEAEGQAILDQSFKLGRPFGVPTAVLHLEGLGRHALSPEDMIYACAKRFSTYYNGYASSDFGKKNPLPCSVEVVANIRAKLMTKHLLLWEAYRPLGGSVACCYGATDVLAHEVGRDKYKETYYGVITPARRKEKGTSLLFTLLAPPEPARSYSFFAALKYLHRFFVQKLKLSKAFPLMAQYKSLSQFSTLWHEAGHSAGAGEPQTEMMSTYVTRQAFQPNVVVPSLMVRADARYVNPVLHYKNDNALRNYGWAMGQVTEEVLALPEEEIDAMAMEDIKDIRFRSFDNQADDVAAVAKTIEAKNQEAFAKSDLKSLFETACDLCAEGAFGDKDSAQYKIASRFALAAQRLSTGDTAYEGMTPETVKQSLSL